MNFSLSANMSGFCSDSHKSRDIGESCTKMTASTEDDDWRITANYHSLWVSLCLLYFLYTFHEVSLQIASLAWGILATAGDNSQTTSVQTTHVFFVFVLFTHPNLCTTTQHEENMRNLYWCSLARVTNNHSVQRALR